MYDTTNSGYEIMKERWKELKEKRDQCLKRGYCRITYDFDPQSGSINVCQDCETEFTDAEAKDNDLMIRIKLRNESERQKDGYKLPSMD